MRWLQAELFEQPERSGGETVTTALVTGERRFVDDAYREAVLSCGERSRDTCWPCANDEDVGVTGHARRD